MIERIVAERETAKKAYDMGLKCGTKNGLGAYLTVFYYNKNGDPVPKERAMTAKIQAPTAEEVPLPCGDEAFDWFKDIDLHINKNFRGLYLTANREYVGLENPDTRFIHYQFDIGEPDKYGETFNEATARLEMSIWLIENVPEAKQWYESQGVLSV